MPLPPPLKWVMEPVADYSLTDAAGPGTLSGTVVVPVKNLPRNLSPTWLDINPRNPRKTKISQAIRETLTSAPGKMLDRNLGIWVSLDRIEQRDVKNAAGKTVRGLVAEFINPKRHGLLNGGNTYLTCTEFVEEAQKSGANLDDALVSVHVRTGLSEEAALEMAEALNKTVQVKETSLLNQGGYFDHIHAVMAGHPGAEEIQYFEGDTGTVPIQKIIQVVNLFNCARYSDVEQPTEYARAANSIAYYRDDYEQRPSPAKLVITRLPEILALMNKIEKRVRDAWVKDGSKFAFVVQHDSKKSKRSSKSRPSVVKLPFISDEMKFPVPWGLTYPILGAFRANVDWDLAKKSFEWHVDPDELLDRTVDGLVAMLRGWYKNIVKNKHIKNVFTELTRDNPQTFQGLYGYVEKRVAQNIGHGSRKLAHA